MSFSLEDYLKTEQWNKQPDEVIYDYYDENGNKIGSGAVKKGGEDPVGKAVYKNENGLYDVLPDDYSSAVSKLAESYTPTVKIKNDKSGFILSGSKTALDSPLAKELRSYLKDTFKYADLASANVADAIDKINNDLQTQIQKSVVESIGGNYEWYKDYANAKETMQRQNPMSLSGDDARDKYGIWGYNKSGNRVKKLPQEWIDYWRENYSAEERANLFNYSKAVANGQVDADKNVIMDYNLWTPYLVMSGGEEGDNPVYGFDPFEQVVGGAQSFINEINKLGQGIQQMGSNFARFITPGATGQYLARDRMNDLVHSFGKEGDILSTDVKRMSEEQWKDKLGSIIGKKISDLTDEEKTFLAASVSGNSADLNSVLEWGGVGDGYRNSTVSKDIENFASYEGYDNGRKMLSTLEKFDKEMDAAATKNTFYDWGNLQDEVEAAKVYAPVSVTIGTGAGVILRTLAESGLISSLSGGLINLSNIGDSLAEKIIKVATKVAGAAEGEGSLLIEALNKPLGKFLLSLAGEIPEDVVQTAFDNIIIDQADENATLLTPENIAENTVQNLAFRAIFGTASKALDYVSAKNAVKALKSQSKLLENVDPDQLFDEWRQFKNARMEGRVRFDENGHAVITDANGNEKVLENVSASVFNNTGDAQLDAVGAAWREQHYTQPIREKLAEMRQSGKNYVKNVLGVEGTIEDVKDSGKIHYTGVQNVVTVPKSDPYYGIRSPEMKVFGEGRNKISIITRRAPRKLIYYTDLGNILKPKDAHKATIFGSLLASEHAVDTTLDAHGVNVLAGTDISYNDTLINEAAAAKERVPLLSKDIDWSTVNTPEGLTSIREKLGEIIDERVKTLLSRANYFNEQAEYSRKTTRDLDWAVENDDAYQYLINLASKIEDNKDELIEDIITLMSGGRKSAALSRTLNTIKSAVDNGDAYHNKVKAVSDKIKKDGEAVTSDIAVVGPAFDPTIDEGVATVVIGAPQLEKYSTIYHIPEGTKILDADYTDGVTYFVDTSAGYEVKNGEVYINNPNGTPHTPVLDEFNTYDYTIKEGDSWFENDTQDYQKFGKEFLKPVGRSRTKASDAFYELVKGGGSTRLSPNVTSARLRASGEMGQLNPTTPTTILDKIMHDAYAHMNGGDMRIGTDLSALYGDFDPDARVTYDAYLKSIGFWRNAFYMASVVGDPRYDGNTSGFDSQLDHIINTYMSPEISKWGQTPQGQRFKDDLKALSDWIEYRMRRNDDGTLKSLSGDRGAGADPATYDGFRYDEVSDAAKGEIAERILDLAIKYQGANGFEMMPLAYQAIEGYKYAAPYAAKKPFVVTRGMTRGENFVGANTTGKDLLDLRVGDDWNDSGYAFTTLKPESADYYASGNGDGVYFRYHVPAGAPVIYYGDTSHFGRYVAQNDGGPIVLPRNWPAKVTKVTHTRGGVIVDISLADNKGNYAGLITPRDRLNEKLGGTTYKGDRLKKPLDSIFGDGAGELILYTVAGDGDIKDVTYEQIYKFLNTQKGADLNRYLFHQMESEPLVLFRGQEYGKFEGDVDVDEVGFSNENVIRNLQQNGNPVDPDEIDSYPFTKNPDRAREFGNNIVRAEVDRKYVLTQSEIILIDEGVRRRYNAALEKAYGEDASWRIFNLSEARRDIDNYPALKQELSEGDLAVLEDGDSLRAYALASGKPIVEYVDAEGNTNYLYFPGTNEDFDKSMVVNMYDSEATTYAPVAVESNDAVAADAFRAVETQPYNKNATEIVDELYERMSRTDLPENTPDSDSPAWSAPRVGKNYYKEGKDTRYTVRHAVADLPTDPAKLNSWHANSADSIMESFRNNFMPEFTKAYPTPEDQATFVHNMDYLFHLQKHEHVSLVNAIGREYTVDGITYKITLEDAQFYKNFVEPQMKDLRDASKAALGVDIPTTTGYFPHTDYSPENLTSEEILQGVLWKHYTGSSAMEDGTFTTSKLSSNIESRYRTFVNNMLWDVAGERLAAAKFMEEMHADGVKVTAKQANNAIKAKKAQAKAIEGSAGAKKAKAELKKEKGQIDWKGINDDIANTPGSEAWAVKMGYGDIYGTARGNYSQPGGKASIWTADHVSTMSVSDWMRAMVSPDGSLYDQGGAMVVNGDAAAKYMAGRFFDENMTGAQFKEMLIEYLTDKGRRSAKGAEYIADKWMDKILQRSGNAPITRMALGAELQWMIRYEGINRVDRWIARADLKQFSKKNIGALDQFIRRQGIISSNVNDSDLMGKINRAANAVTAARMKSLFWFNFKNGVLQTSECIRLFTEFKIGDAFATIRKMKDADFMARVDEWVDMIVPDRYTDVAGEGGRAQMLEGTTEALNIIANKSSYKGGALNVEMLSPDDIKELGAAFDKFASSPVDFGEKTKNRVLMAGILQEADRKGLTGNELFNYVNKRFERIGLAANDMGRLTAADNPFFRLATNLKSFGIREANMYINNIRDLNDSDGAAAAISYVVKNLGWKGGLLLIMSKLGYGALSVFGLDPFGLMDDQYTGVDEEDYNWMDRVISNPAMNALLSGGFTSFIPMLYWASRQAYENTVTPTEDVERGLDPNRPAVELGGIGWDQIIKMGTGFVPGYTQGQRVIGMTDLLNRGWAIGMNGNKKYEAPTSPFDVATGFIFGQSNTPQARAYNQTPDYLQGFFENGIAGIGQQIGREWGGYRQFDPIDSQSYTDWFNGSKADEAQWRAGYYHFYNKIDEIIKSYEDGLKKARSDEDRDSLKQSYNQQLNDLMERLRAFSDAYTLKHPEGIDEEKMNNLLNILNTYRQSIDDDEEVETERRMDAWNRALERYAAAGLPAITTYRGNNADQRESTGADTSVVYSPQVRAAVQGEFGLPSEAAAQIRQLYKDKWKNLNQQYRDRLFSTKGSKAKKAIQEEYLSIVRQDLDPIVELYGNNIWSNEDVENIIDDVFNSMVTKYGQSVKSYLKNIYKNYHGKINYSEQSNSTISEIKRLLDVGKTARAKALARTLKQRVQENRAFLNRNELEWLQGVLND